MTQVVTTKSWQNGDFCYVVNICQNGDIVMPAARDIFLQKSGATEFVRIYKPPRPPTGGAGG